MVGTQVDEDVGHAGGEEGFEEGRGGGVHVGRGGGGGWLGEGWGLGGHVGVGGGGQLSCLLCWVRVTGRVVEEVVEAEEVVVFKLLDLVSPDDDDNAEAR